MTPVSSVSLYNQAAPSGTAKFGGSPNRLQFSPTFGSGTHFSITFSGKSAEKKAPAPTERRLFTMA